MTEPDEWPELLSPARVADILQIDRATLARWRREGRLIEGRDFIELPGGNFRYYGATIRALINPSGTADV